MSAELTIASIARGAIREAERAKALRKFVRYAKDVVMFGEQGKVTDAARALERAAQVYVDELKDQP